MTDTSNDGNSTEGLSQALLDTERKVSSPFSVRSYSNSNTPICLPLSTRLIGSLAGGMYCRDCRRYEGGSFHLGDNNTSKTGQSVTRALMQEFQGADTMVSPLDTTANSDQNKKDQDDDHHHDYNLQQLAKESSQVISPLVLAPMLQPHAAGKMATVENIMAEYIATCKFYGCDERVNAGVLTTLRFSLPSLRVGGSFHDADMLALTEILLRHGNGPLRFIKRLDFSRSSKEGKIHGQKGFRSHGALCLAKFLSQSEYVEEVRLQGNRIGPYGASALFLACSRNRTVKRLALRQCRIGEQGGLAFAELLDNIDDAECGLADVDLSVNGIGFRGCLAIEKAMLRRVKKGLDNMYVDTMGNLVLQEIMNGCSHGLGILLALIGAVLMSRRVHGMSHRHVISSAIYSASLLVLYVSSTLYHSFFALQYTRYIFEVFDKCAIYILIAGSYTPFITIVMINHFELLITMLIFIWAACFLGIHVEYAYPTWSKKGTFGLLMYLGMGWVAALAPEDVVAVVPQGAINLIVLGGVGYTAGVPFFLRDNFLDHSIWHLFVLSGSIFHWAALYFYIVDMK